MLHKPKFDLIIVIPCYNESKGLLKDKFLSFLQLNPTVAICFVNDGSTDHTLSILEDLKFHNPFQIIVYNCAENGGKAQATRLGMLHIVENYEFEKAAYLDADLATSLKECLRIGRKISDKITFAFGSRVKILGANVHRTYFRFLTGRVIATFISNILKLDVYDTQCGAKVFHQSLVASVFKETFLSKWLFDVEIFFRILNFYDRKQGAKKMLEVPLKKWIDRGDSKVKMSYFFKLWIDLIKIHFKYKHI